MVQNLYDEIPYLNKVPMTLENHGEPFAHSNATVKDKDDHSRNIICVG